MPKREFRVIIFVSVIVAFVVFVLLAGYNYFVTKPLTFYEKAVGLKLVKYIPGDKTKLATDDLLHANVLPKSAVVNKIDGKYYYSLVAKLESSLGYDSTISAVTLTGKKLKIKYDFEYSSTCLLWEYAYKDGSFKDINVLNNVDSDFEKCWQVYEGYKYIKAGDLVEIVWESDKNEYSVDSPIYNLVVKPGS